MEYGFQLGDERYIFIESETEKDALLMLINTHWDLINKVGEIQLMGELLEKHKLNELPDTSGEDYEE